MNKIYLKILKEDSSKKDKEQIEKEKISTLIVAGDSIGVGFCRAMGEKSYSDLKPPYDHIHNLIESRPSVRGGRTAAWIAGRLTNELNQIGDCTGAKLVIIAGTNDALMFSRGLSKTASSAAKSVRNVINHAISKGIKKEDISVMKLHIYTGKKTRKLEDETAKKEGRESRWGKDYKNSKGKTVRSSAVDVGRMQQFINSFNSSFSDVKTFDMVKPGGDGVHASGAAYKSLVRRACDSLNMDCSKIQIPKQTTTGTPTAVPSTGGTTTTNRDCHINDYCNCVDNSIARDGITVLSVQRALTRLGFKTEETSSCDSQTQKSIQMFQKQQQQKNPPYEPIHGTDKELGFLRCDGCVGINTMDAINKELAKLPDEQKADLQNIIKPEEKKKLKINVPTITPGVDSTGDKIPRKTSERAKKYYPIIEKHARAMGFPVDVAMGITYVESNFNPNVVSHKGAAGLMQLMVVTAEDIKMDPNRRFDPEANVQGALKYISKYLPRYLRKDMKTYKVKFSWDSLTPEQKIRLQLYSYNMGARAAVKGFRMFRFNNIEEYFKHLEKSYMRRAGYDYSLKALKFAREYKAKVLSAPLVSEGDRNRIIRIKRRL